LTLREPGINNADNEPSPAGTFVGLGVKISNTQIDLEQGSMEDTHRPLDVAIEGDGFFRVKILESIGDGFGYTRNGNFFTNKDGELVLGMGDGYKLLPTIKLPPDARDISISQQGVVEYVRAGSTQKQKAGDLKISTFIN